MTANLFFVEKRHSGGSDILLQGSEHHHLSRVARLGPGDEVWLFDEEGDRIRARVERITAETTRLKITERRAAEARGPAVTLAQAVLKRNAMDEVVSGAVEWGIENLVPVLTERTVVKLGSGDSGKADRWRSVALAAAKQCKSGRVPSIEPVQRLDAFLAGARPGRKLVLSEAGGRSLGELAAEPAPADGAEKWIVLVGPEGGWAEREIESVVKAGFAPASLGRRILRASTAALSAVAILTHARDL